MIGGPGGGGLELRLYPWPLEELGAVDVVSCALAVVSLGSLGFEELVVESISVATALRATSFIEKSFRLFDDFIFKEGAYVVSRKS